MDRRKDKQKTGRWNGCWSSKLWSLDCGQDR